MSSSSQTLSVGSAATAGAAVRVARMPWYCFAVAFGAACVPLGALWDISWHVSIGRDSFWTPAHIMIYLGGALPGCVCGWLVLKETFWSTPGQQVPGVRLWGFRGPLGAWVVIWGSFAMLVSAPFDDWWHNAYGLDVKIISPPHTLLALGIYAVAIGGLLMVASWQNRSPTERHAGATLLFFVACGTLLTQVAVFTTEYTYPNHQHAAFFYQMACRMFPLWLVIAARASNGRWGATGTAAIYTAAMLVMVWILPLFPAQPKLAPIYNPIDHMVPPPFPLLLIVPAVGIDLVMQRFGRERGFWRDTALAAALGVLFFALVLAVQWPFSSFLLSPASRNAFFAGNAMWGYFDHVGSWCTDFWDVHENPLTLKAALFAILCAALVCRLALAVGNGFRAVKR